MLILRAEDQEVDEVLEANAPKNQFWFFGAKFTDIYTKNLATAENLTLNNQLQK